MLKVMTIVGTRPEIIRLSRVIDKLDRHCDHVLVHTGQNSTTSSMRSSSSSSAYGGRDVFLGAAGATAAETIGNVIIAADRVLRERRPDAVLLWATPIARWRRSPQSASRYRFSTWRQAIGALISACRRRSTGGSWIISRTSICPIAASRATICCAKACRRSRSSRPVAPCAK